MVNNKRSECIFNIEKVEEKYNATYVGQFCLKTRSGDWANESSSVFYQENPPVEGYSHYFALIARDGQVLITSGQSAVEGIINGIRAENGEIIYSAYRHDYTVSEDKSVFIDGGRDYVKSSIGESVALIIDKGRFVEIDLPLENDNVSKKSTKLK